MSNYNCSPFNINISSGSITGSAYGDIGPVDEYRDVSLAASVITTVVIVLIGLVVFFNKRMSKKHKIVMFAIIMALWTMIILFFKILEAANN